MYGSVQQLSSLLQASMRPLLYSSFPTFFTLYLLFSNFHLWTYTCQLLPFNPHLSLIDFYFAVYDDNKSSRFMLILSNWFLHVCLIASSLVYTFKKRYLVTYYYYIPGIYTYELLQQPGPLVAILQFRTILYPSSCFVKTYSFRTYSDII